jgi:hypothetical protein
MIQLTCNVQVFSGFKPPQELIPVASQPHPPPPQPSDADDGKPAEDEKPVDTIESVDLPTYDEAVAETLGSPVGENVNEEGRGYFEVDAKHLQGAESWDDEKK